MRHGGCARHEDDGCGEVPVRAGVNAHCTHRRRERDLDTWDPSVHLFDEVVELNYELLEVLKRSCCGARGTGPGASAGGKPAQLKPTLQLLSLFGFNVLAEPVVTGSSSEDVH